MPTVPTYQDTQQHVPLRPEYTEGFTVQADAKAFGAAIGKGMQNAATGLGTLGEAVVKVEELDNANAAKDADAKFADWQREATYGKGGYLTLTSRAAVEGRAAFEKLAEQKRAEFGKGLRPGAMRAYQEATQARMNTLLDSTIRHQADQRKAWFAETSANTIKSSADDAIAVYNDPAKVDAAIARGVTEIARQGHMQGWSKEKLDQQTTQFVSDTTRSVALQMANESAIKAEQYAKTTPGLLPAARTELMKTLEAVATQERARHNATDIIAGLPPTYTGAPESAAAPSPGATQTQVPAGNDKTDKRAPQAGSDGKQTTGLEARDAGNKTAGTPAAASQAAGSQTTAAQALPRQPSGPEDFRTVAGKLAFPGKVKDDPALAGFVKNAAGASVDPSLRPWLSHVAGAILGATAAPADLVRTAATDASRFRRFGLPTETPRAGDIVVLGPTQKNRTGNNRENDKGQIGFFRGYDADGNILMLGPDARREGETALTAHAPTSAISFRTSGTVDEKTMTLPNYTPDGLQAIEDGLNRITDPKLRTATEAQLNGYVVSQKKAIDAQRIQMQEWANKQVISDPTFDPTALPIDIREAIGLAGMSTLLDYKEKVRAYGQPKTDDHVLYDLQTQFASDPAAFARIDLFEHRPDLSDKDWEKVTGWQQMALTDLRKARLESLDINTAFELARPQLEPLGFFAQDGGYATSSSVPRRVAQFRSALLDQMDVFKEKNDGQNPTQSEIQKMINRLLLPIVISAPHSIFGVTPGTRSGYLYQANTLADDESYDITVQYEDIPRDLRLEIGADLTKSSGQKPTRAQIEDAYEALVLSR